MLWIFFFDDFSAPEELDAQTEGTGGVFSEPVAVVDIIKKIWFWRVEFIWLEIE